MEMVENRRFFIQAENGSNVEVKPVFLSPSIIRFKSIPKEINQPLPLNLAFHKQFKNGMIFHVSRLPSLIDSQAYTLQSSELHSVTFYSDGYSTQMKGDAFRATIQNPEIELVQSGQILGSYKVDHIDPNGVHLQLKSKSGETYQRSNDQRGRSTVFQFVLTDDSLTWDKEGFIPFDQFYETRMPGQNKKHHPENFRAIFTYFLSGLAGLGVNIGMFFLSGGISLTI